MTKTSVFPEYMCGGVIGLRRNSVFVLVSEIVTPSTFFLKTYCHTGAFGVMLEIPVWKALMSTTYAPVLAVLKYAGEVN